jgi:hypothetical protein
MIDSRVIQERVVKLRHGAIKLALSPDFNAFTLNPQDRQFLGELVDIMDRYEDRTKAEAEEARA